MKLQHPPDPEHERKMAVALRATMEREGWVRPNHTQRTGLSTFATLHAMRAAGAPHRLERTGRWRASAGEAMVELWLRPWVLRAFQLYTGRKQDLVTSALALLVEDETLRAAFFGLADIGHADAARLMVRRALAAQPPAEETAPMDWTTALAIKGVYVVCERGDDEVWRRSGPHHTTKEGAIAAIRALMLRVGYLRVAMLDKNGHLMKTPRPSRPK